MSAAEVYHQVKGLIRAHLDPQVDESTLERVVRLVTGMVRARSASPAQVAKALNLLQLTGASAESLERRIRRLENDQKWQRVYVFIPLPEPI